jgi:hypothetical protein
MTRGAWEVVRSSAVERGLRAHVALRGLEWRRGCMS